MKKLIIGIAGVALAATVNAATVNWKVTGSSGQAGYTAYLLVDDAVTTSWESLAALQAAAIDNGAIAKSGRNYVFDGQTTSDKLTKSSSFYYVLVSADSKSFATSELFSGANYVFDTTAEPPETAPATIPTFVGTSASFKSFTSSGPVPEPTSGLLMFLGMAGLALRRKIA